MKVNIEVTAGPAKGRTFKIDQADLFIVGRAKDSKISLPNDPYLSRQHFVLEIAPPNCKITDLGSKNGTFVNGVRYGGRKPDPKIKQAPNGALSVTIQTGEIVVGDTRMKVSFGERSGTSVLERSRNGSGRISSKSSLPTVVRQAPDEAKKTATAKQSNASAPAVPVSAAAFAAAVEGSPKAENASPLAADSSLGFLVPRTHARSLQAVPVLAPSSNPSSLHINAAPLQLSPNGAPATHIEPPELDGANGLSPHADLEAALLATGNDPNCETVREAHETIHTRFEPPPPMLSGEQTVLEAPPHGIDPSATVLERLGRGIHPVAAANLDDKIICATCGKNASAEVGVRARIAGAEYICHTCRASRAFAARDRVARKNRTNSSQPRPGSSAALDLLRETGIVFPGYEVIDVLGTGGMGVVYKAVRKRDKQFVAIKSLLPNVPVSFENYRIFHREIEVTRKLKHPNIVEVLDHGNVKGAYYCVLEFVDGLSLKDYIHEMGGKLTLKQCVPLMMDTLAGLAAAHTASIETRSAGRMLSGIVHRDLKPENILLKRDAFGWVPKIADFGIAKGFESAGMTDMTISGVCGTPTYWPREQLTHYRYLHPATDVFSIAAVFYEMLAGKCARPGMRETLMQCHKRSVTPELADFMRVIASNPIPPINEAVPSLPAPIAAVLDKALLEIEVPLDEVEMRETLQRLRYPDAGVFREALASAFKYSNITV